MKSCKHKVRQWTMAKLHKIKFRKDYMQSNPWITHGQCYRGNTWQICVLTCLCSKNLPSHLLGHDGTLAFFDRFQPLHPGFFKETIWFKSGKVTITTSLIIPWQGRREQLRLKGPTIFALASKIPEHTDFQKCNKYIKHDYKVVTYYLNTFLKHLTLSPIRNHCKVSGYNRRNNHKSVSEALHFSYLH